MSYHHCSVQVSHLIAEATEKPAAVTRKAVKAAQRSKGRHSNQELGARTKTGTTDSVSTALVMGLRHTPRETCECEGVFIGNISHREYKTSTLGRAEKWESSRLKKSFVR